MELDYIRLVEERREDLWTGLEDHSKVFSTSGSLSRASITHGGAASRGPLDHLAYLKERRGEKIVAVDRATGAVVGWVGVFPDRDARGAFHHLAGIEVHADHRGRGIGTGLMEAARGYALSRRSTRLRFGTSPLLAPCAALYVTRLGTRYRWKEGVRLADGRPWPCVSCECDFDDPLPECREIAPSEAAGRSVVSWDGGLPLRRRDIVYSGALAVLLPPFTTTTLSQAVQAVPRFLESLYDAFEELFLHGYGFSWFARLGAAADPRPNHYYVMTRSFAL